MSRTLSLGSIGSLDINNIHKFGVGFDRLVDQLDRMTQHQGGANYPHYNVVKVSEDTFIIEIATAGFTKGEVSIELTKRTLSVTGDRSTRDTEREFLYKGISDRGFVREFSLADNVEITGAETVDGILSIYLKRVMPPDSISKIIDIVHR